MRNSLLVASPIESMASNSSVVCHKCHHKGHIASRCPQCALALDVEHSILEDEENQNVDPDSCHGRVIRNQQNLFPIFLLLP